MSQIDEYIKKKSKNSTEWQKKFEIEYKKLLDNLVYDNYEKDSFKKNKLLLKIFT
ncbi:hypothetical protein [Enterococcus mundtii]|uniref:hypothetical protein n=1 Tax=Enterococcus mundtii TaxID=53346 RepID=UPI00189869C0|nr:hypothetical protein [Enterococcus mundtii]MDB7100129.1 hypothetical protein [Enterococcus mundtii]